MAYWCDIHDQPTCLYRVYSHDDILVYVGVSMNPTDRMLAHKSKPWWDYAHKALLEWFPDRRTALDAERHAIYHEDPVFNIARPLECC